jgi:hypothetical protein
MREMTTKCDVCGQVKGQANKWLQITIARNYDTVAIHRPAPAAGGSWISVGEVQDICSDTCLQKRLGEVLKAIRDEPHVAANTSTLRMDSFDEPSGVPIPKVTPDMPREPLGTEHATEHYRITEWVKPTADSPYHKFFTDGPGVQGKCYIALGASCGPHLIKSLEAAWQAGWDGHQKYVQDLLAMGIPIS